jgi:hypothetical protein
MSRYFAVTLLASAVLCVFQTGGLLIAQPPEAQLTSSQQDRVDEAWRHVQRSQELLEQGKAGEALPAAEQAAAIFP